MKKLLLILLFFPFIGIGQINIDTTVRTYYEDGTLKNIRTIRVNSINKQIFQEWIDYFNNGEINSKVVEEGTGNIIQSYIYMTWPEGEITIRELKRWIRYKDIYPYYEYISPPELSHETEIDSLIASFPGLFGTYNGWKHGVWKGFYKNGELEYEWNYIDGKREGIQRDYYRNGQVKKQWTDKEGMNSLWTKWYENGNKKEEVFLIDGYQNGIGHSWYENGELQGKGNFKDDKYHGLIKLYYENGQLKLEGNYENGIDEGLCKWYYENGQLHQEGNMRDGLYDGLWKAYYKNGQLKEKGRFKNGIQISSKCWDESGKKIKCKE